MTSTGDPPSSADVVLPPGVSAWLGEDSLRRATVDAIRLLDVGTVTAVCSTQHAPRVGLALAAYYVDRWRTSVLAPGGAEHAAPFLTTFLQGPPVGGATPIAEQLWALQRLGISGKLLRLFSLLDVAFVHANSTLLEANWDAPCPLEHLVGSDLIGIDARHLGAPPRIEAPPGLQQLLGLRPRWGQPRRVLVLAADAGAAGIVVQPLALPGEVWRMRIARDAAYTIALRSWTREQCRVVREERPIGDALSLILDRGERDSDPAAADQTGPVPYDARRDPRGGMGLGERSEGPYRPSNDLDHPPAAAGSSHARPTPDTPAGREKLERRLARSLARFFDDPRAPSDEIPPEEDEATEGDGCAIVLELQASEEVELRVQVGPLAWLPPSVRRLTIRSPHARAFAIANNLRSRRWPVVIPMAAGRFELEADASLSAEESERLATLAFDGPSHDALTVFELGADGVGTRIHDATLTSGRAYLLLAPPGHAARATSLGAPRELTGGWTLLRVEVPTHPSPQFLSDLGLLGFDVDPPRAEMRWAGLPPHLYRQNVRGDDYPCFLPIEEPIVRATPPARRTPDGAWIAVHGPDGLQILTLVTEEPHMVALGPRGPGRYVVELASDADGVERVRLPFEVLFSAASRGNHRVTVAIGVDRWEPPATIPPRDLGALDASEVSVLGPPFWPTEVTWSGLTGGVRQAGEFEGDGHLDVAAVWEATQEARAHDPTGRLTIDSGDLGRVTFAHRREMSGTRLHAQIAELISERGALCNAALSTRDTAMLAEHWLGPILQVLGYRLGPALSAETDAPSGVAFWTVLGIGGNEYRPRAVRIGLLALTPGGNALSTKAADPLRALARARCEREGLHFVLMSDGWSWTRLVPHRDVRGRTYDLRWFADPARVDDAEDFLERFAAQPTRASVEA